MAKSYQSSQKNTKKLKTPKLDVVVNQYSDRDYNIHIEFNEFTCVCPKTGLPDFAKIVIDYVPDKKIVELKSLKLYFCSFRSVGIFHEHVVNKILEDLVAACQPRKANISAKFNTRGGLDTTVSAGYSS